MPDNNNPSAAEQLRQVAAQKENELLVKNTFQEESNEYSASKVPAEIDGALTERSTLSGMNEFKVGSKEYSESEVPDAIGDPYKTFVNSTTERITLEVINPFRADKEYSESSVTESIGKPYKTFVNSANERVTLSVKNTFNENNEYRNPDGAL